MLFRAIRLVGCVALSVVSGCSCDSTPQTQTSCDNANLSNGCVVGNCKLTAGGNPLPQGSTVTLTEAPVPNDIASDSSQPSVCVVALPTGVKDVSYTLSITLGEKAAASAVLFSYDAANPASARTVIPSGPDKDHTHAVGVITGGGTYGATERPAPWTIDGYIGADTVASDNQTSLVRNLSANFFGAAHFDGKRLFVGNGARVLAYDSLAPSPSTKPAFILGQADIDTSSGAVSSALFGGAGITSISSGGGHLAIATGSRVLLWNQMPSANLTPADVVLGQNDFVTNKASIPGTATRLGVATVVDATGGQLFVADALNYRVLVWNGFPSQAGAPADFVIGQPDFTSNAFPPNAGAVQLWLPSGVAATSSGVYLSGLGSPGLVHLPAISQNNPPSDFSVFGWRGGPGQPTLTPCGVVESPTKGVAERDYALERIIVTRGAPSGPALADFTLGQPDATRTVGVTWVTSSSQNSAHILASSFGDGRGLGGGGGTLLVPDDARLLVYETFPTYNFEPPTRVIGQAGFAVNEKADYRGISASTLAVPADVAVNGSNVAIADKGNNRVLLFHVLDLASPNAAAFAVVGQPDMTSYVANLDLVSPTAGRLSGPEGVALDGTHLVVADTENHRVLIWNAVPTTSGVPADVVLGQADFTGRRPNHGRGDTSPVDGFSDVDADGLFYPTGVASDGTHLFVADRLNHRVLVWDTFPKQNGKAADRVLGQPSATTVGAHRGAGAFSVAADGFNLPTGVTLVGTTLWVADTENNRVVRWDNATTNAQATAWIGQSNGTTVSNPNYVFAANATQGNPLTPTTTAASVLRPRGVTVAGGRLFISEMDSNRVHVLDAGSLAPVAILGQASDTGAGPNANGVNAASLADPQGLGTDGSNVFAVDAKNHRVVAWPANASSGAGATMLVGQQSFLVGSFDQSSTAAGGVTSRPSGLAILDDQLYIADTNNHRVLVVPSASATTVTPTRIYGQPDDSISIPNTGGAPTARSLNGPRGVYVDEVNLVIADTDNHRVLLFDPKSTTPDAALVLGHVGFDKNAPNAGGPPSANSLRQPTGVCGYGPRLYVADTGNHRVLVWNKFPTQNNQAADAVIGQPDMTSTLPNRGGGAGPDTLSFPTSCAIVDDALLIADSGNNRIVRFVTAPKASGSAADNTLGQADFISRTPASSINDLAHLAGPTSLATDGPNLYVVDRDLGRTMMYTREAIKAGGPAREVLGGVGGPTLLRTTGGIAVRPGNLFTTRVFASDTSSDRIAVISPLSRLLEP